MAVAGDTVVVGAHLDDVSANGNQGSAYVFTPNGGVWTQQQQLNGTGGATDDRFGTSVAVTGDTALVGTPFDDIGANTDQGSAYLFTRTDGVWTQQPQLNAGDGAAGDRFGTSVAVFGDTALVGANLNDIGANNNQGSAYVYTRSAGVWTQQQQLTAAAGAANDLFGVSVAVSDDTAVVGAYTDLVGANADQGSAAVFTRTGSMWTQQQQLTATGGAASDLFGVSVAVSGDTAVVGASQDDVGANGDQGSAHVFPVAGFSVDDVSEVEGGAVTFTVSRSGDAGTASVDVATADGTATVAGHDYVPLHQTVMFGPGEHTQTVTVTVWPDTALEADELFFLELSDPSGALIARGRGQATIANDDAQPSVSIGDFSFTEGSGGGTTDATFTLSLSAPSSQTITVQVDTDDGTAEAPDDYTAATGTATFLPGQTQRLFAVGVVRDNLDEPAEHLYGLLSNPTNATIADPTGIGVIVDDDPLPGLSIDDVTVTEGNTGKVNATFTVSLTAASGRVVRVAFATVTGTANGHDYTHKSGLVTFEPGQTTATVNVKVKGDTIDEGASQNFFVNITNPVRATITDGQGEGTITDDDP